MHLKTLWNTINTTPAKHHVVHRSSMTQGHFPLVLWRRWLKLSLHNTSMLYSSDGCICDALLIPLGEISFSQAQCEESRSWRAEQKGSSNTCEKKKRQGPARTKYWFRGVFHTALQNFLWIVHLFLASGPHLFFLLLLTKGVNYVRSAACHSPLKCELHHSSPLWSNYTHLVLC